MTVGEVDECLWVGDEGVYDFFVGYFTCFVGFGEDVVTFFDVLNGFDAIFCFDLGVGYEAGVFDGFGECWMASMTSPVSTVSPMMVPRSSVRMILTWSRLVFVSAKGKSASGIFLVVLRVMPKESYSKKCLTADGADERRFLFIHNL